MIDDNNEVCGKVWARLTKVPSRSHGQLNLVLQAKDLKRSNLDPFFEVRRTYDEEECDGKVGERQWPIYRSEYIKDNLFKRASIDINDLCGGDLNRTIEVVVFDHERKGGHELIGSFDTTVNKLMAGRTFDLEKDSKVCGSISVDGCKIVGAGPSPTDHEPEVPPKIELVVPAPEPGPAVPTPKPDPAVPTPKSKPVVPTPDPANVPPKNEPSAQDDGRSAISSTNNSASTKKSEYIGFLSNYEEMVRRQDFEYDYTSKYLNTVFKRVQHLGRTSSNNSAPQDRGKELLTYSQMRRCLLRIGVSWDNSLPMLMDDDISVNSFDSASGGRDNIALDTQLVMLLTTLVEVEERYRADKLDNCEKDHIEIVGVCFLEFVQVYQIVVASMQTLQMLNVDETVVKEQMVDRVRGRTFGLIRPFGPDFALYKEGDETGSNNVGLRPSSGRIKISDKKLKPADDDGWNKDELNALLQVKDEKIELIRDTHKMELDEAADHFEALKQKCEGVCNRLEWKIKLWIIGAVIFTVGFLEIIVTRVHQRQLHVKNGIAALREEDNTVNTKLLSKLNDKRDALQKKVGDTEGTMRYLMSRNEGVDASNEELEAEMKRIAEKYFFAETEYVRCDVEEKELKEVLTNESALLKEMEQELGWCQKRKNILPHVNKPVHRALIVRQVCSVAVGFVASSMLHKLMSGVFLKPVKPVKPVVVPPPPPPPPPPLPPKNALQKILQRLKNRRFFIWKRNERAELAVIDGFFDGWIAYYVASAIAVLILP